jgi:cyanosortase A-associated protein
MSINLSQNRLRVSFLILVFLGIFSSLIYLLFFPPQRKARQFGAFEFPNSINLPTWNLNKSQALSLNPNNNAEEKISIRVIKAHRYQFSNATENLTIDTRYIVNTDGEVSKYLNHFYGWKTSDSQLTKSMHLQKGLGYYSLTVQAKNAILTSCINPNGPSTILGRQYVSNRNIRDFKLNRLMPWLLNQTSLKDERCLWVYMSLPLADDTNEEQSFKTLRAAWISWYQWWEPRFPQEINFERNQ